MTPHKITPDEYHQMGPIFLDTRLELIEGELFDMSPIGTPHVWTVGLLTRLLNRSRWAEQAFIYCQSPLSLPDSEPEPDHRQPDGERYHVVTTPNILIPLAFPELALPLEDLLP